MLDRIKNHSCRTLLLDTLLGQSCGTLFGDTLVAYSCGALLWGTFMGPSCETLLLDTLVRQSLYYKACTRHSPVLLCSTKLARGTSQYYFVQQSLHKELLSTTLYNKACTKNFQVLLCTTKLAQGTSQYYFVLQSLHKALSSTTVEGWSQSNFLECGQTACGKVATTGSQQGHSNPSKHKGIAFIWRIQSTIITNTREPTPRTADYSSASTALHYKQSFCHNGLIWEGVRLSERRKQWKEKK